MEPIEIGICMKEEDAMITKNDEPNNTFFILSSPLLSQWMQPQLLRGEERRREGQRRGHDPRAART